MQSSRAVFSSLQTQQGFGFSVGLDKVDKVCSWSDIDFVGALEEPPNNQYMMKLI